jgi:hypothetical protein
MSTQSKPTETTDRNVGAELLRTMKKPTYRPNGLPKDLRPDLSPEEKAVLQRRACVTTRD